MKLILKNQILWKKGNQGILGVSTMFIVAFTFARISICPIIKKSGNLLV
jgi:hypothetical protein